MPSLNIRSLPFVVFMGGFPSRLQNLSSGAIRPGGLLLYLVSCRTVSSSSDQFTMAAMLDDRKTTKIVSPKVINVHDIVSHFNTFYHVHPT